MGSQEEADQGTWCVDFPGVIALALPIQPPTYHPLFLSLQLIHRPDPHTVSLKH